jgi:hypothetical protein
MLSFRVLERRFRDRPFNVHDAMGDVQNLMGGSGRLTRSRDPSVSRPCSLGRPLRNRSLAFVYEGECAHRKQY